MNLHKNERKNRFQTKQNKHLTSYINPSSVIFSRRFFWRYRGKSPSRFSRAFTSNPALPNFSKSILAPAAMFLGKPKTQNEHASREIPWQQRTTKTATRKIHHRTQQAAGPKSNSPRACASTSCNTSPTATRRASACAARKIDPKTLKKLMMEHPDFAAEVRAAETLRDQRGERVIFSLMNSENEAIRIRAAMAYQARVDNTNKAREAKREKAKAAQLEQEKNAPPPPPASPQTQLMPEEAEVIMSMRLGNHLTTVNDRVGVTQTYQRTGDMYSLDVITYQCETVPTEGDERGRHFLDLDRPPRVPSCFVTP